MSDLWRKAQRLYFGQPETLRKAERDALAVLAFIVLSSGVLYQDTPDFNTLSIVIRSAIGLAAWRAVRKLFEKMLGGGLPPERDNPFRLSE